MPRIAASAARAPAALDIALLPPAALLLPALPAALASPAAPAPPDDDDADDDADCSARKRASLSNTRDPRRTVHSLINASFCENQQEARSAHVNSDPERLQLRCYEH